MSSIPTLLTPDEVGEHLGETGTHIKRRAARGEIESVRIGNRVLFTPAAVSAFIAANTRAAVSVGGVVS